ncbi:MAG: LysM peptidoglycan-binding domain-containing protein, partial [Clostridia bacterium]|nr:LysM peptidoglycan-binding domain-containing protein [Clostridia bacterium]
EDTLWSIAERYHTTPAAVAAANRLPFTGNEEAALPHSLDGVSYLLVE